jgi:hypothetical protein
MRIPQLFLVLLLVSCGGEGSDTSAGSGSGGAPSGGAASNGGAGTGGSAAGGGACEIEVSGALSGTRPCDDLALVYIASDDATAFSLSNATDPNLVVTVTFGLQGEPEQATYSASATTECAITVKNGAKAWQANNVGPEPIGSCALTLSQLSIKGETSTIKTYDFHGSLEVDAPANTLSGAEGSVHVATSF